MSKRKLPRDVQQLFQRPDVLEYFRRQGAEGGKKGGSAGGKKAAAQMTRAERIKRAKTASAAAAAARKAKARTKDRETP
jgi:hypothetical protein